MLIAGPDTRVVELRVHGVQGTTPQTLKVAALFTSTGPFASSLGFGTLTVVPAPTGDVITNGTFDNGLTGWVAFATPDPSDIVVNITNGVLQFYWQPDPGQPGQATVYQETGLALGAFSPLTAQFDLGNSSSVPIRLSSTNAASTNCAGLRIDPSRRATTSEH